MGAAASLHANQARRQICKEDGHLRSPQLFAQQDLASLIDAMDLKQVLGQIDSNRCNLHRGRSHFIKWLLAFPLWHIDAV
jgi:hypothetical protein